MAARAPVRPRVLSPVTGQVLLLEDEVRDCLDRGPGGPVCVYGGAGVGKTTALAHLAQMLAASAGIAFLDEPEIAELERAAEGGPVVFTRRWVPESLKGAAFCLASWDEDDLIEYLLHFRRERCGEVMQRVRGQAGRAALAGNPELWAAVLERMADDPDLETVDDALRAAVRARWSDERQHRLACRSCLRSITRREPIEWLLTRWRCPEAARRMLRHQRVRTVLAAEQVAADVVVEKLARYDRGERLPDDLIEATGDRLRRGSQQKAVAHVLGRAPAVHQSLLASLLHVAAPGWAPMVNGLTQLSGARLRGVYWRSVRLPGVVMERARLDRADLVGACLDDAVAHHASFRRARLRGASLLRLRAYRSDFSGADLRSVAAPSSNFSDSFLARARLDKANLRDCILARADLRGASFARADLTMARLERAAVGDTDFRGATLRMASLQQLDLRGALLDGADLMGADLTGCHLEGMTIDDARFELCRLDLALLTGSHMPGASFAGARLRGTGLAEISWPGCDLRNADLLGASFHLGSSRSGHVASTTPSEGSRTGFYTDELHEQDYRAPEEIRKADLREADLRGAEIEGVDFYLVDLRGARYDAEQAAWLRQTGAIL